METIVLMIHLLLALGLVAVVLAQRSESGLGSLGGGSGGGGGGMGGLLGNRTTANLLTRTTAVLAACFMVTSIALAILAGGGEPRPIVEEVPASGVPAPPSSTQIPAVPGGPAVPKSQ
jgi:preprotein translocase subunit SecG